MYGYVHAHVGVREAADAVISYTKVKHDGLMVLLEKQIQVSKCNEALPQEHVHLGELVDHEDRHHDGNVCWRAWNEKLLAKAQSLHALPPMA